MAVGGLTQQASAASSWALSPGDGVAAVAGAAFIDGSVTAKFSPAALPVGAPLYVGSSVRQTAACAYRTQARLNPDGSVSAGLRQASGGGETAIGTQVTAAVRMRPGDSMSVTTGVSGGAAPVLGGTLQITSADPARNASVVIPAIRPAIGCQTGLPGMQAYLSQSASQGVTVVGSSSLAATAPTAPASTSIVSGAKPSVGVPSGISLTTYNGPLTITTPGTVIDSKVINGIILVRAPNVRITRSKVIGGPTTQVRGVVTVLPEAQNFVIEDSEVYPGVPSVLVDGIKGSHFTARRVHVHGGVDNIKVHGDNVIVEDSYLHDTNYFPADPFQAGGATHNDNIQVLGGNNIHIRRNTLVQQPNYNSALQVTQDFAPLTNFTVIGNKFEGGTCSVNINHKKLAELRGVRLADNVFGRNTKYTECALLTTRAVYPELSNNRFADGTPIRQRYM